MSYSFWTYSFWKQTLSPDVRGEKTILLVDLASAAKIILTIREDFSNIYLPTANFLSPKNSDFKKKLSRFFEKKYFFVHNLFFFFSPRMVKVIFSADAKSACRFVFSSRKSRDIGFQLFKKSRFLTQFIHIYSNLSVRSYVLQTLWRGQQTTNKPTDFKVRFTEISGETKIVKC